MVKKIIEVPNKEKSGTKDLTPELLEKLISSQKKRNEEEFSYIWEEWGNSKLYFKRLTNSMIMEAHNFATRYYRTGKKVASALLASLIVVSESREVLKLDKTVIDFMIDELPGEIKQTCNFVLSISKQPSVDELLKSLTQISIPNG